VGVPGVELAVGVQHLGPVEIAEDGRRQAADGERIQSRLHDECVIDRVTAVDLAVCAAGECVAIGVIATSNRRYEIRLVDEIRIIFAELALAVIDRALPRPAGPQLAL